jgi:hypothetical protein
MRRTVSALAILALGWFLVFAPTAVAGAEAAAPAQASFVLAQQPPSAPPGPELTPPGEQESPAAQRQRYMVGSAGVVLIGLVLLSRRLRGKPVLGVKWKK